MDVLLLIYNSFVNSKLSYCIEIWGNAPAVYLNKLFLMQKKIIWIINKKPFDHSTSELFQKSKILTIRKIYELRVLIHAHNTYQSITNTHNFMYNTRNSFSCNIPIPLFKTSSGQKTIEYQESALGNRLPLCVKQIENPIAFKKEMKRHLLR